MNIKISQNIILKSSLEKTYEFIVSGQLASTFLGYGKIPGIEKIDFENGSYDIPGSKAIVYNTDKTTHFERILNVEPLKLIEIEMFGHQGAIAKIIKKNREVVEIQSIDKNITKLTQTFIFELKSPVYAPVVLLISKTSFKKAMQVQQKEIQSRLSE
ncbi:MAG: hypothetical protein ACEPO8_09540 [Rhodothermaceae bacterium]